MVLVALCLMRRFYANLVLMESIYADVGVVYRKRTQSEQIPATLLVATNYKDVS